MRIAWSFSTPVDVQYFGNSFHVRFAPPCFGYVHVTSYRWRTRNRRFLCGWRLQGRCPMLVFLIFRIFLISVRKSLITSAMPCSIMCCTLLPPSFVRPRLQVAVIPRCNASKAIRSELNCDQRLAPFLISRSRMTASQKKYKLKFILLYLINFNLSLQSAKS